MNIIIILKFFQSLLYLYEKAKQNLLLQILDSAYFVENKNDEANLIFYLNFTLFESIFHTVKRVNTFNHWQCVSLLGKCSASSNKAFFIHRFFFFKSNCFFNFEAISHTRT